MRGRPAPVVVVLCDTLASKVYEPPAISFKTTFTGLLARLHTRLGRCFFLYRRFHSEKRNRNRYPVHWQLRASAIETSLTRFAAICINSAVAIVTNVTYLRASQPIFANAKPLNRWRMIFKWTDERLRSFEFLVGFFSWYVRLYKMEVFFNIRRLRVR